MGPLMFARRRRTRSEVRFDCALRLRLRLRKRGGALDNLLKFRRAASKSKVVIARPLGLIDDFCMHDFNVYTSYQKQVNLGARIPQDNQWDPIRPQFESALYPGFHDEITFGCLTLSDRGQSAYGSHFIILKDSMIETRTSVFEENPVNFIRKHQILLDQTLPVGYRAGWSSRGTLAVAKLHEQIKADTTEFQFAGILMEDNGTTSNSDFIEAHVFGMLTRRAIECITGPKKLSGADKAIWNRIRKRLPSFGAVAREF